METDNRVVLPVDTDIRVPLTSDDVIHNWAVPSLGLKLDTVGETVLAHYLAKNLSSSAVVGRATFSVTPYKAAQYFAKVECFCFTEQRLEPGEEVPMAVSFYVDPETLNDPDARDVRTITLSYTFYPATKTGGRNTAWRRDDG